MVYISFIIPCGRPYNEAGIKTVESIKHHHYKILSQIEIITCSKEEIKDENVKSIADASQNEGAVFPINLMAKEAKGKYICLLNDDFTITSDIESIVSEIDFSDSYCRTIMPEDWKLQDSYGVIPDTSFNPLYNINNTPFPVVTKAFIDFQGYLLHPNFKHYYSDCFLAYTLYTKYFNTHLVFNDNKLYAKDNRLPNLPKNKHHDSDWELYKKLISEK